VYPSRLGVLGGKLEDVDAVEGPAVRRGDFRQLFAALGEGHVETAFAAREAGEQELQGERRLARARRAVE
jgi:hypothetical protein